MTKEIDLLKTSVENVAKNQEAITANQQKIARYLLEIIIQGHMITADSDTCTIYQINQTDFLRLESSVASNNKDIDLFKTSVEDVAKRQEALDAYQQKLAG